MEAPMYALIICLDCEARTGERAIRFLTKHGRCYDCGSESVMSLPKPELPNRREQSGTAV